MEGPSLESEAIIRRPLPGCPRGSLAGLSTVAVPTFQVRALGTGGTEVQRRVLGPPATQKVVLRGL